jgi:hypothetical protein
VPKGLAEGGRTQATTRPGGHRHPFRCRKLSTLSPPWFPENTGRLYGTALECGNAEHPPISRATEQKCMAPKRRLLKIQSGGAIKRRSDAIGAHATPAELEQPSCSASPPSQSRSIPMLIKPGAVGRPKPGVDLARLSYNTRANPCRPRQTRDRGAVREFQFPESTESGTRVKRRLHASPLWRCVSR